jgi:hypothetical protein
MKNILSLLSLMVLLVSPFSQLSSQTITNYVFTPSNSIFTPIALGTPVALVAGTNDGYANSIPIGFTFYYNGQDYGTVSASTNGFIVLGQDISSSNNFTNNLTNGAGAASPRPIIAPLWDNFNKCNRYYLCHHWLCTK